MTQQLLPPPVWVDQQNAFDHMVADLSAQACIAVDTESNSLHAFRERVCLIQFSTLKKDYVVDPLVLQDLSSLAPIFANPKIQKIFHAADYDLICLKRDYGFTFANIFETMQKADWGARPLSEAQIDYARFDTHYLFQLRDLLDHELHEKDRWEIAHEDFALGCHVGDAKERSHSNGSS